LKNLGSFLIQGWRSFICASTRKQVYTCYQIKIIKSIQITTWTSVQCQPSHVGNETC